MIREVSLEVMMGIRFVIVIQTCLLGPGSVLVLYHICDFPNP